MSFEPQREVNLSFLNSLFIYPLSANLIRGLASSANVQVEIRLLDSDDSPHPSATPVHGLKVIHPPRDLLLQLI